MVELEFRVPADLTVEIDSTRLLAGLERADRHSDFLGDGAGDDFLEAFMDVLDESIVVSEKSENGVIVLTLGEPALSLLPPEV